MRDHRLFPGLAMVLLLGGQAVGQPEPPAPPEPPVPVSPLVSPPSESQDLPEPPLAQGDPGQEDPPFSIDLLPDEPWAWKPFRGLSRQENESPEWGKKTLAGDWLDHLFSTRDSGFTFGGRVTQFGFGIAGGIDRPVPPPLTQGNVFVYTGRGEYDLLFDLAKFGGPSNGRLLVRAEHWYGQFGSVSLGAGTFAPPVFPALLPPRPNDPGVPYITNFLYTQPLSPKWVVFAGKKDVLGSFDQDIFAGGDGTEQFVNQAFIANPAFLLGMPYTSFTTGFISQRDWGGFGAFVYDPKNRTADFMKFDDLFAKGVIVGGEVKFRTRFFGLRGQQHIGGIWKHRQQTDLRLGYGAVGDYPEEPVPGLPTLWDSYTVYYGFDQYLRQFAGSDKGWGLFGRAAITDGNPNPVQYFLSAGVGGYSPLGKRRGDKFGVGWFLVGASDQFGPIPRQLLGPRNGSGVELYYNIQATPWLNITPDFQWLRPGGGALTTDSAFVYGVRINLTF